MCVCARARVRVRACALRIVSTDSLFVFDKYFNNYYYLCNSQELDNLTATVVRAEPAVLVKPLHLKP